MFEKQVFIQLCFQLFLGFQIDSKHNYYHKHFFPVQFRLSQNSFRNFPFLKFDFPNFLGKLNPNLYFLDFEIQN